VSDRLWALGLATLRWPSPAAQTADADGTESNQDWLRTCLESGCERAGDSAVRESCGYLQDMLAEVACPATSVFAEGGRTACGRDSRQ